MLLIERPRRLAAEALGTALLLATIVGSGIMGERLAGGNAGLALIINAAATAAGLPALILTFGPVSGGHFNPLVTLAAAGRGALAWRDVAPYAAAQLAGAAAGTVVANLMFGLTAVELSARVRGGPALWLSEAVATFGLLAVIFGTGRFRPTAVPWAVGAYIGSAYFFTASTSFANPAVAVARALTDTFTGIRPADVPGFVAAQAVGAFAAAGLLRWMFPAESPRATAVPPVPQPQETAT